MDAQQLDSGVQDLTWKKQGDNRIVILNFRRASFDFYLEASHELEALEG